MSADDFKLCINQATERAAHGAPGEALTLLDSGLRAARAVGNERWVVILGRHAAAIAEHQGDLTRALNYLETALLSKPTDVNSLYMAADIYDRVGDASAATKYFSRCLELSRAQENEGMIELLSKRGILGND